MTNLISKINPVAVLKGLAVLAIISFASYFFQYANFMVEVSRDGNNFTSSGESVAYSFKILSLNFVLLFFSYLTSAFVVVKNAKSNIFENGFLFTFIGLFVQSIFLFSSNPNYFVKSPGLDCLDLLIPIFACSIIFFFFKKRTT